MGTKEQVLTFFEKCDEMEKCKFIMATTKIKDILKCIANSPDLYNLFSVATKDFDYYSSKAKYMVTVNDGMFPRSYIVLPESAAHRLAFIFCLLMEFDRETINFNDFLRRFFPEDGSYYASYHAFCDAIIKTLRDLVGQVFKDELEKAEDAAVEVPQSDLLRAINAIDMLISEEKQYLTALPSIADEERESGLLIFTQLYEAVKSKNAPLINALVCGYNYFILYNQCVSDNIEELIKTLASYVHIV